jgi:predicted amidohydrolase YtcJ
LFEKDKTTVDSIITDATIYTVNNSFDKATAMAISDGKILAIGTNDEITNKFVPSMLRVSLCIRA